jgi:hypothetical protein
MTRFHKKRDGILMIHENGSCRFLTMFERFLMIFGLKPRGA